MTKFTKLAASVALLIVMNGAAHSQERVSYVPMFGGGNPLKCAIACKPRAGYGACFARCLADGKVCDAGARNCSN